jgi:hypothetical protein
LQEKGFAVWLHEQFNTGPMLRNSYLDQQKTSNLDGKGCAVLRDKVSVKCCPKIGR